MAGTSTILIIDDEPNLRKTLSCILQNAGYAVYSASNAKEAIQSIQSSPFDLVFLDLNLPDANGINVLPIIRQIYPELPVIILTAHATLESAIEAVRRGARDYILKPINPARIIERVTSILAEQVQPKRTTEIINQIQGLLGELSQINHTTQANPIDENNSELPDPSRFLRAGPLVLDLYSKSLTVNGKMVSIPPTTFDYLVTLVRHSPNTVEYETLVTETQGYTVSSKEAREITRWHMHELRKVLEVDPRQPRMIITLHGAGYRLVI